jgi:hypothetical protein
MVLRGVLRQALTPVRRLLVPVAGEQAQRAETGEQAERPDEVTVTSRTVSRAEVTFEARQDSEGCFFIALVLTKNGRPAAGDRLFTFDLVRELAPREIEALVEALNRCITHLGMATPDPEGSKGQRE